MNYHQRTERYFTVDSESDYSKTYTVDLVAQTCSCPAFKIKENKLKKQAREVGHVREGSKQWNEIKGSCKHLRFILGISNVSYGQVRANQVLGVTEEELAEVRDEMQFALDELKELEEID